MNTLAESGKARRRGLLLITLGGTLLLLVTLIGAALAWHPPRAGFSSRPGFDVLVFGIFAATIGLVAMLGGAAQMRERQRQATSPAPYAGCWRVIEIARSI